MVVRCPDKALTRFQAFPPILYHVTASKNVAGILTRGLVAGFTRGLNCIGDWRKRYIWLTDDPDFILQCQAGTVWIEDNTPVVIAVDCSGYAISQYSAHEFVVDSPIPVDRLKYSPGGKLWHSGSGILALK